MEVIFDYLLAALNTVLKLFGKDEVVVDKENNFFENIISMIKGFDAYEPETPSNVIDM